MPSAAFVAFAESTECISLGGTFLDNVMRLSVTVG